MNQPSPVPASAGGSIIINGRIEGKNFAIGAYAQVHVVEQHFHAEIGDVHLRQMVRNVLQEGRTQLGRLSALGVSAGVAPLTMGDEHQLSSHHPFASPIGVPPLPPFVQQQDLARTDVAFATVNQLIEQIERQVQGGQIQEVLADGQSLNLVTLLVQQGNLALWRFRQGALPLFAEQASLYALAQPQSPSLLAFQTAAKGNREVLRSWVLYQHYRERQPTFIDQPAWDALSQGRWHAVLDDLVVQQRLSGEQAQAEQQYLSAIGESYNADTVQTAAREAEWYFSAALKRQPDQSTAMVNLGALLAESTLLSYIETGVADRTRLSRARSLFQQAQALLEQRPDREGQIALAQCLLYEATSLPPDAQFDTVHWAATQVQQMRSELNQETPTALRLEMAQRNLVRQDASFLDRQKIERARDLLIGAGALAGLVALAESWLDTYTQTTDLLGSGIQTGAAQHAPLSHPVTGSSSSPTRPHSPPAAAHPEPQPGRGRVNHTTSAAGRAAAPHIASKLLSTTVGKALLTGAAVVVVVGGSLLGAAASGKGPFASQGNSSQVVSPTVPDVPNTAPTFPNVPTIAPTTPTVVVSSGPAGVITEFPLSNPVIVANGITLGPDGNMWFTETLSRVGFMTPQGSLTEFTLPNDSHLDGITVGPDGNLWFTEDNQIGRMTPSGTVTEFPLPPDEYVLLGGPFDIIAGPDGNLWFTAGGAKTPIGRITPTGVITEFPVPVPATYGDGINSITTGPDGNLWFTEGDFGPYGSPNTYEIGRMTPDGTVTKFSLPSGLASPGAITLGPDKNLWFTATKDNGPNADAAGWIGRVTPSGTFSGFPVPKVTGGLSGITTGLDGNLWFTESNDQRIGRITPAGVITEFALPPNPNNSNGQIDGTPSAITAGPNGTLWFTGVLDKIGYISAGP